MAQADIPSTYVLEGGSTTCGADMVRVYKEKFMGKLDDRYGEVMEDRIGVIAGIVCKLDGVQAPRFGEKAVGLCWSRFLTVRGMRADPANRAGETWHACRL
ncbi:hypothetical protein LTR35_016533 [Friedmanniomyces endolithicus]|uniref:Uncharacterized protein n=1 Tax=Friedmanniomyces endolithicus TaxID=329885 RepID=A0AAN6F6F9_9PEZI|nr:hypothetical protein LTR35_016533 [Friedmanniomyces endolithicus]KAK0273805.1 hypothetical protein LTS00_015655 [Friedmanniomyces endolithicus]KAK0306239.1 hypothetical protein LTR82_016454 [Friedmanniomyces endolithicus]KAK0978016.1 hypothetical protein LTR54_016041 [Friedmanniomyces endolithicus]